MFPINEYEYYCWKIGNSRGTHERICACIGIDQVGWKFSSQSVDKKEIYNLLPLLVVVKTVSKGTVKCTVQISPHNTAQSFDHSG